VADPAGKTPDNTQVLTALRNLKDFIYSVDFLKMRQDKNSIVTKVPPGAYRRSISQPGEQYAVYQHHSKIEDRNHYYIVTTGTYEEDLELNLPAGTYTADWVDPATGSTLRTDSLTHKGGPHKFRTPRYTVDIALRIKKK